MTKKLSLTFILALMVFISNTNAQTISLASAVNKAGRQRMLVQRMTKDYMSIGANVKVTESNEDIDNTTALFNESFRELTNFAKSQELKDALANVGELWSKFRTKMTSTPNIVNAESIIDEATALTNACNLVVEKILTQNLTTNPNSKYINICGKQRLNLQKLAMYYIASHWGVQHKTLHADLKDVIANFESNLVILLQNKDNNKEINEALSFQKNEWEFLKKSFENETSKPISIYSSTNLMTKEFEALVSKYEILAFSN